MNDLNPTKGSESQNIFRVGGIASLIGGIITLIEIAIFVIWQPPQFSDTGAWFKLFNKNWAVGLLDLDAIGFVCLIVLVPTIIAFYHAMRRTNHSFVAAGCILFLIGTIVNMSTNPAFSMLSLSGQYANAANEAQRTMLLTTGKTMMTIFEFTTWGMGFIMMSLGMLLISIVMLRSKIFTKRSAYLGIAANTAGIFGFIPVAGLFFMFLNPVLLAIWLIIVGKKFLKLKQS